MSQSQKWLFVASINFRDYLKMPLEKRRGKAMNGGEKRELKKGEREHSTGAVTFPSPECPRCPWRAGRTLQSELDSKENTSKINLEGKSPGAEKAERSEYS